MNERGTEPFHISHSVADVATGHISLTYFFGNSVSDSSVFTERVELPPAKAPNPVGQFERAVRLLHLLAGVSYYKSQAPEVVVVDVPTTPADRRLLEAVYDHGLREFAYANRLPIPLVTRFDWAGGVAEPAEPAPANPDAGNPTIGNPLVPFGGGKDSTVVLGMLPEGTPVTVNGTSTHTAVAQSLGHELLHISRRLDRLDELTDPERLNGHIPITAIVSAIAVALAARDGHRAVVMANEAAASESTLVTEDGVEVNHQWSKGAQFEGLFRDSLAEAGVGVEYFSLLRGVSEPQIVSLLSRQTDALPHLISCNRAFSGRTAGAVEEAAQRWCGECPKCLFTFLLLATELPPPQLVPIFGQDLLAQIDRSDGFAELWADQKPFECVGERADAARAMVDLAQSGPWAEHAVVEALGRQAARALDLHPPTADDSSGKGAIPEAYQIRLEAVLSQQGTVSK